MTTRMGVVKLPVSGREVRIQKPRIAYSSLIIQLRKANPRPEAPLQRVGVNGHETYERNTIHPDYLEAVKRWNNDLNFLTTQTIISMGVAEEMDDEKRAEVAELRQEAGAYLPLPEDDRDAWIYFIAIQDDEDFKALGKAIQELSTPTEEAIQAQVERFRS